jgi:RimJ/RimL family protein N-acetyltransferase
LPNRSVSHADNPLIAIKKIAIALNAALETPRYVLEPRGERHVDVFFELLQEESLYRWISMSRPTSLETMRVRWKASEARVSPDGHFIWLAWAVRRKADGQYVGSIDAEITTAMEATNVGYYFFSPFWGQGVASEVVAAATQCLIERGVRRLVATVTVGNVASGKVLQKAGFSFTRILPGNDTIRGVPFDDEEYVRLAE